MKSKAFAMVFVVLLMCGALAIPMPGQAVEAKDIEVVIDNSNTQTVTTEGGTVSYELNISNRLEETVYPHISVSGEDDASIPSGWTVTLSAADITLTSLAYQVVYMNVSASGSTQEFTLVVDVANGRGVTDSVITTTVIDAIDSVQIYWKALDAGSCPVPRIAIIDGAITHCKAPRPVTGQSEYALTVANMGNTARTYQISTSFVAATATQIEQVTGDPQPANTTLTSTTYNSWWGIHYTTSVGDTSTTDAANQLLSVNLGAIGSGTATETIYAVVFAREQTKMNLNDYVRFQVTATCLDSGCESTTDTTDAWRNVYVASVTYSVELVCSDCATTQTITGVSQTVEYTFSVVNGATVDEDIVLSLTGTGLSLTGWTYDIVNSAGTVIVTESAPGTINVLAGATNTGYKLRVHAPSSVSDLTSTSSVVVGVVAYVAADTLVRDDMSTRADTPEPDPAAELNWTLIIGAVALVGLVGVGIAGYAIRKRGVS